MGLLRSTNDFGMSWFDRDQRRIILRHAEALAAAVRTAGARGVLLDPEPYGPSPWSYPAAAAGRSFAAAKRRVRRRGAQVMSARQRRSLRPTLLPPRLHPAYRRHMRLGFGLWVDRFFALPQPDAERRWASLVHAARRLSGSYVWIHSEVFDWWRGRPPPGAAAAPAPR